MSIDVDKFAACMDGVAVHSDNNSSNRSNTKFSSGRLYTVRYILPGKHGPRSMRVSADSPTEAVNATRAAYPDAEIFGVA